MRHASVVMCLFLAAAPLTSLAQQTATPRPATPAPRPAPAAQPGQPALTPAQQAELAKQNAEMIQAAQKVLQMVDAGQLPQLWDGASVVAKRAVTRENFANQIGAQRKRLGAVAGRGQAAVTRVRYNAGASVPEGLYVNVSFPTRFANAPQPVRELVSFRLDEDKVWRLAGYSLPDAK
ncbi:hypothetical protein ARC20_06910 [Stenotrophomonas panacihumi]|uniref:DUF4019 domain-containing protein n=1 Tax=Stenotrophomonas panacihumi TaxID=676599 RepID=A0A0R0AW12_9GAMM|nr:DUF4019 domain-containing protein [Stenotrophomonas panacihumi]KRG45934.1 hypothetical protein ARC20_06910 [Stenotrophomonas panacihumi]PTN53975.1 DUF4019 domain-containing protein [Stenotrophomonas panacihumi]